MKYIKAFKQHSDYEENKYDLEDPSTCFCEKQEDVHYMPYKEFGFVRFYVDDISNISKPITVTIRTCDVDNPNKFTDEDITIDEGNKLYAYNIPRGKGLNVITSDKVPLKNILVVSRLKYTRGIMVPRNTQNISYTDCDTSSVTSLNGTFSQCTKLKTLDISCFDTSNVTDMNQFLTTCNSLESVDVSKFDTSKVTNMTSMFEGCVKLKNIDVDNWNTSNVTSMRDMFLHCSGLISLDVSNFNTSEVTTMTRMFRFCSGLTSLDVSKWNVGKVTSMYGLFDTCSNITSLDVSS